MNESHHRRSERGYFTKEKMYRNIIEKERKVATIKKRRKKITNTNKRTKKVMTFFRNDTKEYKKN